MIAHGVSHLRPAFFTQRIVRLAAILASSDGLTVTHQIKRGYRLPVHLAGRKNPYLHMARCNGIGPQVMLEESVETD
jgi:hypothetical protein